MSCSIRVDAEWDSEAGVWVAESEDVSGLVAEAETLEALTEKLRALIPELIELNHVRVTTNNGELPFDVFAQRHEHTHLLG
jgi:predicted RNase H-like HicB family nuclease